MKIKFTFRIWLWIIVLALALIAILNFSNLFQKGILVDNIEQNSSAFEQGLRQGQIITSIDGKSVSNIDDYSKIINEKFASGERIKTTITTTDSEYVIYSDTPPEITVSDLSKTNIQTGLDLSGGARALVKAKDHKLSSSEANDLVGMVSNRLNIYGISDMTIRPVSDLSGNNYMLIEIAGATPKDLENLISQQGKFEAKIGNETVFIGGEKDISSVARGGQESYISKCEQSSSSQYFCEFKFVVYLSQEAAERHADITKDLDINSTSQGNYLSKKLDLYLDDNLVESLLINENLKGRVTPQIAISGSEAGETQSDAYNSAQEEMKKLQTILMTGSLPFQLEIVKLDTISPTLGKDFMKYIFIAGIAALLSVTIILFIRYRTKSAFVSLLICTSEIIIILGVAAIMRQDLDLPAIAGILAAIGTGVDDQIVVLDETMQKRASLNIKQRIKRAFIIILGAYFTSLVSLLPLLSAGAGLLKGFAIMTIIGITIGVLITRPAFADIIRIIEKE
ncbi:hypothetical protein A3K82_00485 [Candidatus Pacearchaeota archaeon RBG_19FT_COMBO_34_9]|nr:MAG: hypothetical protein A3K82_00485 [Candidatus Pacearchaeota archaeon RBG_19FT_COMBO_34_9]OGJ16242.1 MAG: hypothetical protein A3K74_03390 [Candidatus Pacearchaeota archaeon RBG_13_33_26]